MSSNNEVLFNLIPTEELRDGKKYHVEIAIPTAYGFIDNVKLLVEKGNDTLCFPIHFKECRKNEKGEDEKAVFETDIALDTRAIYRYYFSYTANSNLRYAKKKNLVGDSRIIRDEMYKMSVNFDTPKWAQGKIMYHIFVDRFRRGSSKPMEEMPRRTIHKSWNEEMVIGPNEQGIWNADFFGGDLKGIECSLNYLKSLGVSILYLSPIVWSQSNHRYDTADYENVDPYVGRNEDLKSLCDSAHKKGMKVVLDAVLNHTGNDSKYFNEYGTFPNVGAFQSDNSPYSSFYRKNNGYFDYWWGMTNLPVCNGYSKEWQDYIVGESGIIDQWFNLGIDGLRLDVADELTDDFIEKIRIAVTRNKSDGFIIGEVWKNPMRMGRHYVDSGKGMHSVMNYLLIDALIRYFKYGDVNKLANIISEIKTEYPDCMINSLMNFTSTHDISRAINIFGSNEFQYSGEWAWNPNNSDNEYCKNYRLSSEQYKLGRDVYEAYVFLLTFMPGILSIFYGDEVGMQGLGNLANRRSYPWMFRDKKLLEFFRSIGEIRAQESFLEQANLEMYDINRDYVMFERLGEREKALIAVSRSNEERRFNVPSEYEKADKVYTLKKTRSGLIAPYGGIAIKKDR